LISDNKAIAAVSVKDMSHGCHLQKRVEARLPEDQVRTPGTFLPPKSITGLLLAFYPAAMFSSPSHRIRHSHDRIPADPHRVSLNSCRYLGSARALVSLLRFAAVTTRRAAQLRAEVLDQSRAPYYEALEKESGRVQGPFFFPGHAMGEALKSSDLRRVAALDLPELPALDCLQTPEGVIQQSQQLAAEAFGASRTWFLVNGSTGGVIAAVMAAVLKHRRKTKTTRSVVALPMNSHKSVISALTLSGAEASFMHVDCEEDLGGLPLGVDVQEWLPKLVAEHGNRLAAVVLVSPTYHGVQTDLVLAAKICKDAGIALIVDEAHGAHLSLIKETSALEAGADLVVQSTHKTLTALSQAAMLHLGRNSDAELAEGVSDSLDIVQTSSPNSLLLSSLDLARQQFVSRSGVARLSRARRFASVVRRDLETLGYRVLRPPSVLRSSFVHVDPLRMTVFVRSGFEMDDFLIEKFGVYCELPEDLQEGVGALTFSFSAGTTSAHVRLLLRAFREAPWSSPPEESFLMSDGNAWRQVTQTAACQQMTPREAFFSTKERRRASEAAGCISAQTVSTYPPGIPLLVPGQLITQERLEYLEHARQAGAKLTGACEDDDSASSELYLNVVQT